MSLPSLEARILILKAITNRLFLLREISTRIYIGQLAGISEEQEEALATKH